MRRWLPWGALGLVVVVALAIGARSGPRSGTASAAQRVALITSEIRCPTCQGLSVAESDAKAAQAVRADVTQEVAAGRTDSQILQSIAARYGRDIILVPPKSGFDAFVWLAPLVAIAVGAGALALAFRRWRVLGSGEPTAADRARVEAELRADGSAGEAPG